MGAAACGTHKESGFKSLPNTLPTQRSPVWACKQKPHGGHRRFIRKVKNIKPQGTTWQVLPQTGRKGKQPTYGGKENTIPQRLTLVLSDPY